MPPRPSLTKVAKVEDDDRDNRSSLAPPARPVHTAATAASASREPISSKREQWTPPYFHHGNDDDNDGADARHPTVNDDGKEEDEMPRPIPGESISSEPPVPASQVQAWHDYREQMFPSRQQKPRSSAAEPGDDASFASLASMSVLQSRFNTIEDETPGNNNHRITHDQFEMESISEDILLQRPSNKNIPLETSDPVHGATDNHRDALETAFPGANTAEVPPPEGADDEYDEEELGGSILQNFAEIVINKSPHPSSRNVVNESSRSNPSSRLKQQQQQQRPLKILFLTSPGRHQASAEVLADQVRLVYPGSECPMLDVWESDVVSPYNSLPTLKKKPYQKEQNTWQGRLARRLSKVKPVAILADQYAKLTCERRIRQRIQACNPDAIVSMHPTMNSVPFLSAQKIGDATKKHVPFFTVVDEVGSARTSWFQPNADKIYVFSDRIRLQAKRKGQVPDENIVKAGVPVAAEFDVHAGTMGNRDTGRAKKYQQSIRMQLGVDTSKFVVIVMAEHESEKQLHATVNELYTKFSSRGLDVTICIICGQNAALQKELATSDWGDCAPIVEDSNARKGLFRSLFNQSVAHSLGKATVSSDGSRKGEVRVIALGNVARIDEYMVAADVMVTSADPRNIAEAAAVGLPLMLTGVLPGQESADAEFVIQSGFGWCEQTPVLAAKEVASWFEKTSLLETMSRAAYRAAYPHAAADIVSDIGMITQTWMKLNNPTSDTSAIDDVEIQ